MSYVSPFSNSYKSAQSTDGMHYSKRRRINEEDTPRIKSKKTENHLNKSKIVCPYLFSAKGCTNGFSCRYKHVESKREADRLKLKYLLGNDFDDEAIERALKLMDNESQNFQDTIFEKDEDMDQNLVPFTKDDAHGESIEFPTSPTHDTEFIPSYEDERIQEHHEYEVSYYDNIDASAQSEDDQEDLTDVASHNYLIESLQKSLCGMTLQRDVFDSEKEYIGNIICEVNRDLNIRSKILDSNENPLNIGTAVFNSNGMVIGIISEVIGNISNPFYRVAIPKTILLEKDGIQSQEPFDTLINLDQLVRDEAQVYSVKRFTSRINVTEEIRSANTKPQKYQTYSDEDSTSIDIESLPQDVKYIKSLLSHGSNIYPKNNLLSSMWVSDDPLQPAKPQIDEPEAVFEDKEAEEYYNYGSIQDKSRSSKRPLKGKLIKSNPFQQKPKKRKRSELEGELSHSNALPQESNGETASVEKIEKTSFRKWCIIS